MISSVRRSVLHIRQNTGNDGAFYESPKGTLACGNLSFSPISPQNMPSTPSRECCVIGKCSRNLFLNPGMPRGGQTGKTVLGPGQSGPLIPVSGSHRWAQQQSLRILTP